MTAGRLKHVSSEEDSGANVLQKYDGRLHQSRVSRRKSRQSQEVQIRAIETIQTIEVTGPRFKVTTSAAKPDAVSTAATWLTLPSPPTRTSQTSFSPPTNLHLSLQRVSGPAQHILTTITDPYSTQAIAAIIRTYFSTDRDTGRVDAKDEPRHRGLWAAWFVSAED